MNLNNQFIDIICPCVFCSNCYDKNHNNSNGQCIVKERNPVYQPTRKQRLFFEKLLDFHTKLINGYYLFNYNDVVIKHFGSMKQYKLDILFTLFYHRNFDSNKTRSHCITNELTKLNKLICYYYESKLNQHLTNHKILLSLRIIKTQQSMTIILDISMYDCVISYNLCGSLIFSQINENVNEFDYLIIDNSDDNHTTYNYVFFLMGISATKYKMFSCHKLTNEYYSLF